jgi:hypothetical protein
VKGFLLDAHLSEALATAGRRLAGQAFFTGLGTWQRGIYRQAPDADILRASAAAELVFVTHDKRTIPPLLRRLAQAGEDHGGLVLIPTLLRHSPGAVARKLVDLSREQGDWTNVVVWLE